MPYFSIQTNQSMDASSAAALARRASAFAAELLDWMISSFMGRSSPLNDPEAMDRR